VELIDRVEKKRIDEGLSVRQLAKLLSIPYDRIYKWIKRDGSPKMADAMKLEAWLGDEREKPKQQITVEVNRDKLINRICEFLAVNCQEYLSKIR